MRSNDDRIKHVCKILNIDSNEIITFKDFVESQYNKSYDDIKNNPEIKLLRKAWNISCESLLNVLDGITLLSKKLNSIDEIKKEK